MSLLDHIIHLSQRGDRALVVSFDVERDGRTPIATTMRSGSCYLHGPVGAGRLAHIAEPIFRLVWRVSVPPSWGVWACTSCVEEVMLDRPEVFTNPTVYLGYRLEHPLRKTKRDVTPGMLVVSKYME